MRGATKQEYQPEVTNDISAFYRRVGLLSSHLHLEPLGFYLDNICGTFSESYAISLLEYCKRNPKYHIVTSTQPGRLENRYVPDKNLYLLAEGDKNANLVLNIFWQKDPSLLLEEMVDEALAIGPSVDRSNKAK